MEEAAGRDPGSPRVNAARDERQLAVLKDGIEAASALLAAFSDPALGQDARERWREFAAAMDELGDEVPLAGVRRRLDLDDFEVRCLLLAVGVQVDPDVLALVRQVGRESYSTTLTVRMVVEAFHDDPLSRYKARESFLPSGRMVRAGMISVEPEREGGQDGVLASRFEVTQPTLRFLLGEASLSGAIGRIARLYTPEVDLEHVVVDPVHAAQVMELATHHTRYRKVIGDWGFERILPYGRGVTFLLSGPSGTGKTLFAHAVATEVGWPILAVSGADVAEGESADRELRNLFAEASLRGAIVLVDECDALFGKRDRRLAAAFLALESFTGLAILVTNHPDLLDEALERRILYHFPFEVPDTEMRLRIWMMHLPAEVPIAEKLDLQGLAARYDFTGGEIKNAVLVAVNRAIAKDPETPRLTNAHLETGCRSQLRYALEALTVRTPPQVRLSNVVLPEKQTVEVGAVIAACRNQNVVLNQWGFGRRLATGKGITVLFDGPPGTGKTLTAEVIAGELGRPLYRIDLPEIVSKWVGETEKNIKRVFQEARISHAMLLFDEADALFAARSGEVKSSTDRYANMEVNLLLQEIERFPGIVILTTNHFGSLDPALVRRIQFRVRFEEPDEARRAGIWKTLCPKEAPLGDDVDFAKLAKAFVMTGGEIKNALMRAAYRAADRPDGERRLDQATLEAAARDECLAAGKLMREASAIAEDAKKKRRPA